MGRCSPAGAPCRYGRHPGPHPRIKQGGGGAPALRSSCDPLGPFPPGQAARPRRLARVAPADRPEIRLGALLAELSFALDLAEGQAAGHALRACLIGMTLAERAGLGAEQRSQLYYAHLLKDAGCS